MATSFEFAQKLVQAKDVEELTRLQTEFVQRQMQRSPSRRRNSAKRTRGDAGRPAGQSTRCALSGRPRV